MVSVTRPKTDQILHNGQNLREYLEKFQDMVGKPEMESEIVGLEQRLTKLINDSSEDEGLINAIIFG